MPQAEYHYRGDGKKPKHSKPDAWIEQELYKPDVELVRAVNLSIYLQRPLLLEGEAGCGKSRLAYAVAYELGLPLYVWSVRSSSQAREALYTYDAILRLHDVQIAKHGGTSGSRDPSNPEDYRRFGALGKAFTLRENPAVVLIDEIDKADLDFPNDLLSILEAPRKFEIAETGEITAAIHPPIVIITSNKEKGNLPAPFLRRCVYHYIRFPEEPSLLDAIIKLHLGEDKAVKEQALIDKAVDLFLKIRRSGIAKPPSTSELLDWVRCLLDFEAKPWLVAELPDELNTTIPYQEVLFKLRTDRECLVPVQ